ncbi:Cysteine-rich hydrophobic domain-containing protein 2 [Nymphon striatum]|nr:Cysteine-rich hydrophobic domain-containing protein 2 [Nymphon striatum]
MASVWPARFCITVISGTKTVVQKYVRGEATEVGYLISRILPDTEELGIISEIRCSEPYSFFKRIMSDFDAIYEEDDEEERASGCESIIVVPDPVVVKGSGNVTVFGLNNKFDQEFPQALAAKDYPDSDLETVFSSGSDTATGNLELDLDNELVERRPTTQRRRRSRPNEDGDNTVDLGASWNKTFVHKDLGLQFQKSNSGLRNIPDIITNESSPISFLDEPFWLILVQMTNRSTSQIKELNPNDYYTKSLSSPNLTGINGSTHDKVKRAGKTFILKLYGASNFESLDKYRHIAYKRAIGRCSPSSSFQLASLPPTSAAAKKHLYRTYHTVQEWMGNTLPPIEWGWRSHDGTLAPVETDRPVAPESLLNMVS